jgi:hypothetical protein
LEPEHEVLSKAMNNRTLWHSDKQLWHPTPIQPPAVDPALAEMNGLQRAIESWRDAILSWEFWVSPNGDIREWLRLNSWLAAWLLIPAILIFPTIGYILSDLHSWTTIPTAITRHLIVLPILALVAIAAMAVVWNIIKAFISPKR